MKTITYDKTQWKLVPVEPTYEMIKAGVTQWGGFAENYRAMLAAAPAAPDEFGLTPEQLALEEVMQLGYTVKDGMLYPPEGGVVAGYKRWAERTFKETDNPQKWECSDCKVDRFTSPCPKTRLECPMREFVESKLQRTSSIHASKFTLDHASIEGMDDTAGLPPILKKQAS